MPDIGRITIIGGHIRPDQIERIVTVGCDWWDGVIGCSLIGVGWIHLSSRARCEHGGLCFALLMSGRTRWLDVTQLQIRIDVCDVSDSSFVVCLCVFDCVLLVALELVKGDFLGGEALNRQLSDSIGRNRMFKGFCGEGHGLVAFSDHDPKMLPYRTFDHSP